MTEPVQDAVTFAIILPTYNEAADIAATCESILGLTPPPAEVIVVDGASTDDTVAIVRRYLVRPSMQVVVEHRKGGPATARNLGTMLATSTVVVFVDADVRLPPDFLARLSAHYRRGADVVAVGTEVPNLESVYARYMQALYEHLYPTDDSVGYSQAFSCRRSVALAAGLFPELPGAEDIEFDRRVGSVTANRVVDRSIVVRHQTASTMAAFWRLWNWRGSALPFLRHQMHHVSMPVLVVERAAAAAWSLVLLATIAPTVAHAATLAARSRRRWADLPAFVALVVLQRLAHRTGEWKGLFRLSRPRADAR